MYAIVEIKGQQFKAEEGKFLYVNYLGEEVKEGDAVSFDKVLLLDADGDVKVGSPRSAREGRQGDRFQEETPQRLSSQERPPSVFLQGFNQKHRKSLITIFDYGT